MRQYSSYKDSGIEWIGKIPFNWQVKKLKQLGAFTSSGIDKKTIEGEVTVKMVNYTDIYGNQHCELNSDRDYMVVSCPKEKKRIHQVEKGDLVFTPSSETVEDIGLSALINEYLPDTAYSYHVIRFRFNKPVSHRYKKYLCNNNFVLNQFSKCAKGTTRQILGRDDFKNIQVMLPSDGEQQAASIYLDKCTVQIDDLIAKKERLIELLKEERTAIINQMVTKGLDPKVEMKDSGIEWLGKVPKHWHLKKLKYASRVNSIALTETTNESYAFWYVDISNVAIEDGFNIGDKINFGNAPSRARRVVRKGDTIVSTVRTYLKAITYFEDEVKDIVVSTGFAVMRPQNNFIPKFLYYVLRSEKFIDRVCALSVGVSYPAINSTDLSDITIWYPDDKEEQKQIVEYLDSIVLKTKIVVKRLQAEIEYLKEYRTALISEVVTGKIDVRSEI